MNHPASLQDLVLLFMKEQENEVQGRTSARYNTSPDNNSRVGIWSAFLFMRVTKALLCFKFYTRGIAPQHKTTGSGIQA